MKVLRKSDRVKFEYEGIEFIVAPLPYRDRIELGTLVKHQSGERSLNWIEQTTQLTKKCLKGLKGLKDYQGEEYVLVFDESGELEIDCVNEVLSCLQGLPTGALINASNSNLEPIVIKAKTESTPGEFLEFTVLGKS